MQIENGDKISVEYTGRLENNEVFDSNVGKEPLHFTVGKGEVVKGFDNAVVGMQKEEEKTVTLQPEDAYGTKIPEAIQKIPKRMVPANIDVGTELEVPTDDGEMIPAIVTDIRSDMVTIDMNHPLADKTLKFKIKILDIQKPKQ